MKCNGSEQRSCTPARSSSLGPGSAGSAGTTWTGARACPRLGAAGPLALGCVKALVTLQQSCSPEVPRPQGANFLQAAGDGRGNTVGGLSPPGLQDLQDLLWVAGAQVTQSIHSRQLDAPRDICKEKTPFV